MAEVVFTDAELGVIQVALRYSKGRLDLKDWPLHLQDAVNEIWESAINKVKDKLKG